MSNAVFPGLLMRLCWTKSKITACEPRNMPWMNAVLSTAGVDWVAPACSNIDAPHTGVKASTPGTGWQSPYRQHCFLKGIVEIVWILAEFPFSNISQMNQYWFISHRATQRCYSVAERCIPARCAALLQRWQLFLQRCKRYTKSCELQRCATLWWKLYNVAKRYPTLCNVVTPLPNVIQRCATL